MALLLGMAISPVIVYYVKTDPGVVYQAAGSTALFVGILGTFGYSRRQRPVAVLQVDFDRLRRGVPVRADRPVRGDPRLEHHLLRGDAGGVRRLHDARLQPPRAQANYISPVPIAASIFLDIFNVFLLLLSLFGGGGVAALRQPRQ